MDDDHRFRDRDRHLSTRAAAPLGALRNGTACRAQTGGNQVRIWARFCLRALALAGRRPWLAFLSFRWVLAIVRLEQYKIPRVVSTSV